MPASNIKSNTKTQLIYTNLKINESNLKPYGSIISNSKSLKNKLISNLKSKATKDFNPENKKSSNEKHSILTKSIQSIE